ncbi:MAG: hypothetical protein M1838_001182 [Thelocarpon superellum]|nr:MAG: hypothetical protein M1838_001182 [Thelocarpon superellum]
MTTPTPTVQTPSKQTSARKGRQAKKRKAVQSPEQDSDTDDDDEPMETPGKNKPHVTFKLKDPIAVERGRQKGKGKATEDSSIPTPEREGPALFFRDTNGEAQVTVSKTNQIQADRSWQWLLLRKQELEELIPKSAFGTALTDVELRAIDLDANAHIHPQLVSSNGEVRYRATQHARRAVRDETGNFVTGASTTLASLKQRRDMFKRNSEAMKAQSEAYGRAVEEFTATANLPLPNTEAETMAEDAGAGAVVTFTAAEKKQAIKRQTALDYKTETHVHMLAVCERFRQEAVVMAVAVGRAWETLLRTKEQNAQTQMEISENVNEAGYLVHSGAIDSLWPQYEKCDCPQKNGMIEDLIDAAERMRDEIESLHNELETLEGVNRDLRREADGKQATEAGLATVETPRELEKILPSREKRLPIPITTGVRGDRAATPAEATAIVDLTNEREGSVGPPEGWDEEVWKDRPSHEERVEYFFPTQEIDDEWVRGNEEDFNPNWNLTELRATLDLDGLWNRRQQYDFYVLAEFRHMLRYLNGMELPEPRRGEHFQGCTNSATKRLRAHLGLPPSRPSSELRIVNGYDKAQEARLRMLKRYNRSALDPQCPYLPSVEDEESASTAMDLSSETGTGGDVPGEIVDTAAADELVTQAIGDESEQLPMGDVTMEDLPILTDESDVPAEQPDESDPAPEFVTMVPEEPPTVIEPSTVAQEEPTAMETRTETPAEAMARLRQAVIDRRLTRQAGSPSEPARAPTAMVEPGTARGANKETPTAMEGQSIGAEERRTSTDADYNPSS